MGIRKRGAAALAAIALAAAGTVATAGTSHASWSECPAGALCAYLGTNGSGAPGKVYNDNSNLLQYNKFNNAESLYNNGNSCNVRIFSGTGYTGSNYVLSRGWTNPTLSGTVYWHNVASNDWCV